MRLNILRRIWFFLDFFTKCCHKHTKGSNIIIPTTSPNALRKESMGQNFSYISCQQAKQLIFNFLSLFSHIIQNLLI